MTGAASAELGIHRVRINNILPVTIRTATVVAGAAAPWRLDRVEGTRLLEKVADLIVIANADIALHSNAAEHFTIQSFPVDGDYVRAA